MNKTNIGVRLDSSLPGGCDRTPSTPAEKEETWTWKWKTKISLDRENLCLDGLRRCLAWEFNILRHDKIVDVRAVLLLSILIKSSKFSTLKDIGDNSMGNLPFWQYFNKLSIDCFKRYM